MDDFTKLLNQKMKNADFKEKWESSEPEYQIVKAMLQARNESEITQQQYSK